MDKPQAWNDTRPKTVLIFTTCRRPELLYGSILVFRTLRVGLPTSRIVVVDNASVLEARPVIKELAIQTGCEYIQLETRIHHHDFLDQAVFRQSYHSPLIIVDPDVMFWENVEGWSFNAPIAGRLIPEHYWEHTETVILPRIHPSLLWIQDVDSLCKTLDKITKDWFGIQSPFTALTARINETTYGLDTGAVLYSWLGPDNTHVFGEKELNAYDHLFSGSILDWTAPQINNPEDRNMLIDSHIHAVNDYTKLRGLWRQQDKFFKTKAVKAIQP